MTDSKRERLYFPVFGPGLIEASRRGIGPRYGRPISRSSDRASLKQPVEPGGRCVRTKPISRSSDRASLKQSNERGSRRASQLFPGLRTGPH